MGGVTDEETAGLITPVPNFQIQQNTGEQNLRGGISQDGQPLTFRLTTTGTPVLIMGAKQSSTDSNKNAPTAVSVIQDIAGNNCLAVVDVGKIASQKITQSSATAVSVGVASGVLLAANTSRRYALFVNTSAAYVSLNFGAAAVLYSGITLSPNGGSYEMSIGAGNVTTQEVRAIASAAASNVGVQEGT